MPRTSQALLTLAAILSLAGVLAHEIVGAPRVLIPLRDSGLPPEVIWLHHFSWRVGTVAVVAMIVMFVLAALKPSRMGLAVVATAMAAGFSAVGLGLAVFGDPALWNTPAPYAWLPVTLAGAAGVWSRRLGRAP